MNVITDLLLPAALAFIMFSLGLGLRAENFRRVVARPKALAAGLLGQMVLLPALALGIALLLRLPPEMAAGLMILAACPGGVSSGLITQLARGETALSISLTAITSLLAVASLPFIVDLTLGFFEVAGGTADFSVARLARGMFLLTTVPVVLGMLLRHFRAGLAERLQVPAERLSTLLFLAIVLATFVSQRQALAEHLGGIGPAAALLNLSTMAAGFAVAAAAGLDVRGRIAIVSECGLQNAALGIYVAATVLQAPRLAVPSVVYALLMNVSAIALIVYMRRSGKENACVIG